MNVETRDFASRLRGASRREEMKDEESLAQLHKETVLVVKSYQLVSVGYPPIRENIIT